MSRKFIIWMAFLIFAAVGITGCGKGKSKKGVVEVAYDINSDSLLGEGITYQMEGKKAIVTGYQDLEMEDIKIPDKIYYDKKEYAVTKIADGAFESDVSLVRFTAGANITSIGESAFYACDALESIDLVDCVQKIGKDAFGGCTLLSELKGMKKVQSIAGNAFGGCTALTDVTIPKSVESMGSGIFMDCTSLKRCVLEEGVIVLGESMFTNCSALSEVTLPQSLVSINAEAFWGCGELSDLALPDKLTFIGEKAFYDTGIKKLKLPNSISGVRFEMLAGMGELECIEVSAEKEELYMEQFQGYGIEIVTY